MRPASALAALCAGVAIGAASASVAQDPPRQLVEERKGVMTASGIVISTSRVALDSGEAHELVRLRRSGRGVVVVDLGVPGAYAGPAVREGDRLVVSGKAGRIDGEPVIIARYAGHLHDIRRDGDAASASSGASAMAPAPDIHASALIGKKVATPRGEPLGWIAGLLLDSRPRGQHYALLAVEGEQGKEKRFAYPVNALRRGGTELLLNVRPENLQIAPGYRDRAWPSPEVRSGERYLRARTVLGSPILDPLGRRVGRVDDMVVSLDTGRTRYFMVDFRDGGVLPMPEHAVRLSPGGPPTLQPDSDRRS